MPLVIHRKPGQFVRLDLGDGRRCDVVVIRDTSVNGNGRLKLMIDAPESVRILRGPEHTQSPYQEDDRMSDKE